MSYLCASTNILPQDPTKTLGLQSRSTASDELEIVFSNTAIPLALFAPTLSAGYTNEHNQQGRVSNATSPPM